MTSLTPKFRAEFPTRGIAGLNFVPVLLRARHCHKSLRDKSFRWIDVETHDDILQR